MKKFTVTTHIKQTPWSFVIGDTNPSRKGEIVTGIQEDTVYTVRDENGNIVCQNTTQGINYDKVNVIVMQGEKIVEKYFLKNENGIKSKWCYSYIKSGEFKMFIAEKN